MIIVQRCQTSAHAGVALALSICGWSWLSAIIALLKAWVLLLDSPRQRVSNGSQRLSLIAATKGKSGEFARCSRRHGPALGLEANGERSREIAKLSSATRTGNANAC
jgi:hypothetical protein